MSAFLALPWRSMAIWLAAFCSPTLYFLGLMLVDRFHVPAPPEFLVAWLFFLIPVVALLVCASVVWWSAMARPWKVGWMLFTLLGMLLQFGAIVVIISAVQAAISYAQ